MQPLGATAGHYEARAVAAARAALQLSSLPLDSCHAHLALGKAYLALHNVELRPTGSDAAWTDTSGNEVATPAAALPVSAGNAGAANTAAAGAETQVVQHCLALANAT